jgi:hypothetical protein
METINRREFVGHLGKGAAIVALAGMTVEMSGCNVISDIENWIPVGEAAVNSILSTLAANNIAISPVAQAIVKDVFASFDALSAAITEYDSVTPPPAGALAKVQAAFKAITDQLGTFLQSLQLPGGNIVTLIVGLANIVFSTITAFTNQLPVAPASFMLSSANHYRLNGVEYTVVSKKRTRREFKKSWNAQLDSAKQNGVIVPQSAYLRLSFLEHF